MFNTGLIDSLRVRVKMDKVKILDKRVIDDYIVYYPSLDQFDDDLRKAPPYTKIFQGITYRFYPKAFINSKKTSEEYMVFQISAKMVKQQYFEGITMHNVQMIVDGINQWGAIKVTKEALLQGLVSDIDICINQLIDPKSLETAFALIRNFPRPSKKPHLHFINKVATGLQIIKDELGEYKIPLKVKNLGIDFNKREKGTNSMPYCKIYHKGNELQTKSSDFYALFLSPMRASVLDNLVRYEFTVKNAKHKAYLCEKGYNAGFKTFGDLLKTSAADLKTIAMSGLNMYLEAQTRSKVDTELSPRDIMVQYYIENLIKLGFDSEKLLGFTYLIEGKVQRSVTKTHAKKLIANLTANAPVLDLKLQHNNRANNFLNNLGFQIP